ALPHAGKFGRVLNPWFDSLANSSALGDSQVVVILQIKPKLGGQAEVLPQANGRVGANSPVPTDDFIDAGEIESLRQCIATEAHRFHEFGLENISRMNCKYFSDFRHGRSTTQ